MSNYQNYLIQTALDAHNKSREQLGAPPLKHNPDLSKTALKKGLNIWIIIISLNSRVYSIFK
jgi:hypothetical protein